ncbi:hypothetical protein SUGI_0598700 [Cryptomeria japonica]|nr:hypothetical protein SUGI_0598700 [Cryptomeria japonica]
MGSFPCGESWSRTGASAHCGFSFSRSLQYSTPSKRKSDSGISFDGYSKTGGHSVGKAMSLPTVLTSGSLQRYAQKLWPQGNPKFCESLTTCSSKLANLTNSLLKSSLQGLGLSKHFQTDFVDCEFVLHLNYLSECEKASDGNAIHLKEHKDLGVMTILYNDQVGGLEMCSKQGQ